MIYVAIVEDDNEIRESLSLIIDSTPGYTCKLIYSNAEDAVAQLSQEDPDVVLMDVELPGISGIQAVSKLKPILTETDFIMLTIRDDDSTVFDAICAGATGYLLKNTPPNRLLQAIDEVKVGGSPMSRSIARKVLASFQRPEPNPLTERETEILRNLCEGHNYRVIADKLFVSGHTVRTHIKNIYKKLHVSSRAEAVRKAIQNKIV